MSQTIIDLWNGNLAPVEHCGARDPMVREQVSRIERHRETLGRGLTQAQAETFQKYMECSEAYLLRMLELAFRDGFCLGSRLGIETLL